MRYDDGKRIRFETRNIQLSVGPEPGEHAVFEYASCQEITDVFTHVHGEIGERGKAIEAELDKYLDIHGESACESEPGEGFMKKFNAFRNIMIRDASKKKNCGKLRGNVHKAISIRNKYAHAELNSINNQYLLEYKCKRGSYSEPRDEPVSKETMLRDLEFMETTKEELRNFVDRELREAGK